MTIQRKNRTKKNRRKTRKNRRKTMRGGLFDSLFSSNSSSSPVAPAKTLIGNSKEATSNAKKSIIDMSTAANTKVVSAMANTALIGTVASNVGYGAIAGLTASGVGIPLAGAIAGALLIANKLSNMYLNNLKLFPIMFDTMSILTNCYKLNELIGKAYEIIQKHLQNVEKPTYELVKKIRIDPEIQKHILSKVNEVTAYLLNIAEDSVLEFLIKDPDIQNNNFLGPVKMEYELRKNNNVKNFFNKAQRGINRFIYVSETKSDIIDNLSLINSFFIIIKSQYDFALQLYEREFGEKWKDVLMEIESTKEYQNYLIPVQNLSQEAKIITSTETEIGKASGAAINAVIENDNQEINDAQQKINASQQTSATAVNPTQNT